jgi:sacsin
VAFAPPPAQTADAGEGGEGGEGGGAGGAEGEEGEGGGGGQRFLHGVPPELLQCEGAEAVGALLAQLGVRSAFGAADFSSVLRSLQDDACGQPLPPEQVRFAAALLELLAAVPAPERALQLARQCAQLAARGGAGALSELVLVPDERGRLAQARELVFDDAPWLSAALHDDTSSGYRFAHPSVANGTALALGVRSLRQQLVVGDASGKQVG